MMWDGAKDGKDVLVWNYGGFLSPPRQLVQGSTAEQEGGSRPLEKKKVVLEQIPHLSMSIVFGCCFIVAAAVVVTCVPRIV